MFLKRKCKSFEEAWVAVQAGTATTEEKKLYRQHKAREARESQAAWSRKLKPWYELF